MNSEHYTHSLTHTHHTYHHYHCTPEGRQSIKEGDHRGGLNPILGRCTHHWGNNSEPEGPGPGLWTSPRP